MDYFTHQLEEEFKALSWDGVYSFIEFTLHTLNGYQKGDLVDRLNKVFQEEGVQYKIIDNQVHVLMNETEANEISNAQGIENSASAHITKSIELFNKRPLPDYSNSIKESISAVESIARKITGDKSAVLSDAIKKINLPPALEQGIIKIYAWTSDEGGIRHSLKDKNTNNYGETEARYLLVLCSALVNFLNEKNL
jgi:hypothetical protein